jgi:hypothetical protein
MAQGTNQLKGRQVGRGALFGVGLGAAGGSLFLLVQAVLAKLGNVDCAGLEALDCDALKDTRLEMAHIEAQFAVVLAAFAIAAFLFVRTMREPAK